MKFKTFIEDSHSVLSALKDDADPLDTSGEAMDFVKKRAGEKQYRSSAVGLLTLLREYSVNGKKNLTSDQFHLAEDGLWRFAKGRLRLYCMIDADMKLIVLTSAIVKKTQKTPKKEKMKAKRIWEEYEKQKG